MSENTFGHISEWTVNDVITGLPSPRVEAIVAPPYTPPKVYSDERISDVADRPRIALAVESMRRHMTDEGWQIMEGLEKNGYTLFGHGLVSSVQGKNHILKSFSMTDVSDILDFVGGSGPSTVVVQDKREWDTHPRDFREQRAKFYNVRKLAERTDIFKLTIVKDAQHNPRFHAESAAEIGCHAWIVYYHPRIVAHLAPYIRPEHMVRTWHTLNPEHVKPFSMAGRQNKALLSGAVSNAYPLRSAIVRWMDATPKLSRPDSGCIDYLPHPGYHRQGCATPAFFQTLSQYKVAICTASMYGYALRKIIEATAAGCVVITDLPSDEVMPEIDESFVRVRPDISMKDLIELVQHCIDTYSSGIQEIYADKARIAYDYRTVCCRLAHGIELLRETYTPPDTRGQV
jgi:hypothetical protein